jgi:hypothetical protein
MKPNEIKPFEKIEVNLDELLSMIDDPLKSIVESYNLPDEYDWARVVGLALVNRYWRHGVKNHVVTSDPPEILKRVREWREHLSEGQIKSIVEYALASCFRLRIEIDDLDKHYSMRRSWIIRFVNLCIRRDNLEAVRQLIRSPELDERLKALDEVGWRFAVTVPPGLAPDEEQLQWARVLDPNAWWVKPVKEKITLKEVFHGK